MKKTITQKRLNELAQDLSQRDLQFNYFVVPVVKNKDAFITVKYSDVPDPVLYKVQPKIVVAS